MYTHEIKKLLDDKNWKLTDDEFFDIMFSSSQVAEYKIHSIKKYTHEYYFITYDGLSGLVECDNYKENKKFITNNIIQSA